MKVVVALFLLLSMIGLMTCSFDGSNSVDSQSTLSVADSERPIQNDDPHHEGASCGDHCHHHGHCGFLVAGGSLLQPLADSSQVQSSDRFYPSPGITNLFRPPIV